MTSSLKDKKRQIQSQRVNALNLLANALRKQNSWKKGFVSALVLLGAVSFTSVSYSQQAAQPQTATSPWTAQNGREIVDLNVKPIASKTVAKAPAKKSTVKRTNHIRQVQASVLQDGDLLGGDLEELPQNPVFDNQPVETPSMLPETTEVAPQAIAPAPATTGQKLTAVDAPTYPQSQVAKETSSASAKNASPAANSAPAYSTNPYSRIGQAEYNPRLFYGTGSPNASINGYRNAPPEVAYGQNAYGYATQYDQGCYDGVFCGFFQNTQLSAGFDGMRSPMDFEDSGNYGGNFAVNWGSVRPVFGGLHLQAGARGVFTDLNGVEANGFSTDDSRNQLFWTAGVYFRANQFSTSGLNFGVVYDSLSDKYYREYDLSQLRTELSYSFGGSLTLGFRGAFGLNDEWCDLLKMDEDLTIEGKVAPTDYYTGFMRWAFANGGEATVYGGATKWSEGLVGGSVEAPISDSFALKCSGSYVFPNERGLNDREEEAWNMSMGIVWYLDGGARNSATTSRPLFDVADNGSFIQDFLR